MTGRSSRSAMKPVAIWGAAPLGRCPRPMPTPPVRISWYLPKLLNTVVMNGSRALRLIPAKRPALANPAPPTTTIMKMGRPATKLKRSGVTAVSWVA